MSEVARGTSTAPAADTRSPDDPTTVVRQFLRALGPLDLDAVTALLDPDVEHETVSVVGFRGRGEAREMLVSLNRWCSVEITVHRVVAEGRTVFTERTDTLVRGPIRCPFWTCGTFEVVDGRIVLWRDYFDRVDLLGSVLGGTARGIASLVRRGGRSGR